MRKIKGFHLRLPFKETRLKASRQFDLDSLGLDDIALSALIGEMERIIAPAVIFETYGPEAKDTAALSPIPGLGHTVGLATLGADVERWIEGKTAENPQFGGVASLLADSALDKAVKFILGLIADDVEEDRCELSPLHPLQTPESLSLALAALGGAKIGLSEESGKLSPAYSSAFCVSWIARKGRPSKNSSGAKPRRR